MTTPNEEQAPKDFIRQMIANDIEAKLHDGRVQTRFPPEPNGYLHIGHVKAICVNFGIAEEFGGRCNLRFDDTNPETEDTEFVEAIQDDIRWLGFDWGDGGLHFASDYFEQLHDFAVRLIESGHAYVDSQSIDEIRAGRGTAMEPGTDSPFRERSPAENLELFVKMRAGEFEDGAHVLRAKIDMKHAHLIMRDPLLYRIRHAHHHRTGNDWCIYPMYDWAHGQSDSIEKVTHSLCSLEFKTHRPLYDWCIEKLGIFPSRQTEFGRMSVTHMITSKRKLRHLVETKKVSGWDDPRMPTVRGMRRRGFTPESLRRFCHKVGISDTDSTVTEIALLEHTLRDHLNKIAPRVMAVLDPLKVVIENYPEDQEETLSAVNNPEDESAGRREVPFSREFYIERADFMEDPPKKFFRLGPGREVRLRYAYFVTCTDVIKNEAGEVVEIRCTYDPATRGGDSPDGRKVKGTLHWVSAKHALDAEVRLYDHLFSTPDPTDHAEDEEFTVNLNPDSLFKVEAAKVEPHLGTYAPGDRCQFERLGYFCADSVEHTADRPVFNRTVTLRDTWAKTKKKG